MKEWVVPYLKEETISFLKSEGYDSHMIEDVLNKKFEYLEPEEGICLELMNPLKTHFWIGGFVGAQELFTNVFSTVLGDLPEQVYKKICQMENLFFVFNPSFGAEVKIFHLEQDLKANEPLRIVVFPPSDLGDRKVLRGMIVHELVHVFEEHDYGPQKNEEIEEKTDEIAKSWGFEKEINAMREYGKRMKLD